MPNAAPHPCPTCRQIVVGRCARCAKQRDRMRGSASARGYKTEWAPYARQWLRQFPFCGQRLHGTSTEHSLCAQRGERVLATVVDHIRPLRDGGALLDPANHQSLCASCNTRKG
jgi:5-methylcytosine-specific restriction protein A